jgi:hypothetical protein
MFRTMGILSDLHVLSSLVAFNYFIYSEMVFYAIII